MEPVIMELNVLGVVMLTALSTAGIIFLLLIMFFYVYFIKPQNTLLSNMQKMQNMQSLIPDEEDESPEVYPEEVKEKVKSSEYKYKVTMVDGEECELGITKSMKNKLDQYNKMFGKDKLDGVMSLIVSHSQGKMGDNVDLTDEICNRYNVSGVGKMMLVNSGIVESMCLLLKNNGDVMTINTESKQSYRPKGKKPQVIDLQSKNKDVEDTRELLLKMKKEKNVNDIVRGPQEEGEEERDDDDVEESNTEDEEMDVIENEDGEEEDALPTIEIPEFLMEDTDEEDVGRAEEGEDEE